MAVRGLRELTRAFQAMDKDLAQDLVWELQEAADPVRSLSTQIILGGGGGMGSIENMSKTPFYADMRVGVSKAQGMVYVVPDWKRGTGAGTGRPRLAGSMQRRMEAALATKQAEVIDRMDDMLGRLASDWGRGG